MSPPANATRLGYFAVTAPGLEALLQSELRGLGVEASPTQGGIEGKVTLSQLWDMHLASALAESVRVRLKSFIARDFESLEAQLARLPWHAYLAPKTPVQVRVTCHKSRLFHSDAVAERVLKVIERARGPNPEPSADDPFTQQIFLRLLRDEVTPSIDASGERLHRRGYRTHVERAPLRETLAAAMVQCLEGLQSEPTSRLCDPFCGSGVLPLEWLERRNKRLPGARRTFAFERWPIHDAASWKAHREARILAADNLPPAVSEARAFGSDIDTKAAAAARVNAEQGGHAASCEFGVADFRAALLAQAPGTAVLTNPPYGIRIGSERDAQRIYSQLDRALAARPDLRPVVISCVDRGFAQRATLPWRTLAETKQGGLSLLLLGLGIG
jgi:putative N6-adenine-specific DNA methylase